eukprot:7502494-Pyramimonas_sp.AAC.1
MLLATEQGTCSASAGGLAAAASVTQRVRMLQVRPRPLCPIAILHCCKEWKHYSLGQNIKVLTDHKPLAYLDTVYEYILALYLLTPKTLKPLCNARLQATLAHGQDIGFQPYFELLIRRQRELIPSSFACYKRRS